MSDCDCSCNKTASLLAYEAETQRLYALLEVLGRFCTGIGERGEVGSAEVDDPPPKVEEARSAALIACFAAVGEIAATTIPVGRILPPYEAGN